MLDSQYLKTAIELGLVSHRAGRLLPGAGDRRPRRTAPQRRPRAPAALRGVGRRRSRAALCSLTFDSLSFPMFANVHALVIGLVGAGWRLAVPEGSAIARPRRPSGAPHRPPPTTGSVLPVEEAVVDLLLIAKDLALPGGDSGDRPHARRRGVRRRRQGPGVRGEVKLRPDQSPAPPTAEEIARDPALGRVNSDNPCTFRRPVGGRPSTHRHLEQRVGTAGAPGPGRR